MGLFAFDFVLSSLENQTPSSKTKTLLVDKARLETIMQFSSKGLSSIKTKNVEFGRENPFLPY